MAGCGFAVVLLVFACTVVGCLEFDCYGVNSVVIVYSLVCLFCDFLVLVLVYLLECCVVELGWFDALVLRLWALCAV